MVDKWLKNTHEWLLPPTCVLCHGPGAAGRDLCPGCEADLPYLKTACQHCAMPLPVAGTCGACQQDPPPFATTRALFHYREPVDHLIQRLKFNRKLYVARLLGDLLAQQLAGVWPRPDAIIPVPLHPLRLRQRGFNQALELARPVAEALSVPLLAQACRRERDTPAQSGLDAVARHRNLKGAFKVDPALDTRHVALVDDVMTTGSTVAVLAQALRRAGVARIDVWVVARAD
ncbi:MAG: ComF family protein [Gammaproteobacteria bacterium]|nr:ComF family protein [Gammaproteobacteria bacterium]